MGLGFSAWQELGCLGFQSLVITPGLHNFIIQASCRASGDMLSVELLNRYSPGVDDDEEDGEKEEEDNEEHDDDDHDDHDTDSSRFEVVGFGSTKTARLHTLS